MADEQAGRALGAVDPDDPRYDSEIADLNDAPTERTSLLRSSSSNLEAGQESTPRIAPRLDNSGRAQKRRRSQHSRPALLLVLYIIGCLWLFANIVFLTLSTASLRSPIVAAFIPAHASSAFLPMWLSILSIVTNALALTSFVFPTESPKLSEVTNVSQ